MSLVQRCPYFGVSFKRGSTVCTYIASFPDSAFIHGAKKSWGVESGNEANDC